MPMTTNAAARPPAAEREGEREGEGGREREEGGGGAILSGNSKTPERTKALISPPPPRCRREGVSADLSARGFQLYLFLFLQRRGAQLATKGFHPDEYS